MKVKMKSSIDLILAGRDAGDPCAVVVEKVKTFAALGFILAFSACSTPSPRGMEQGKGVVSEIKGSAQYSTGGGVWLPLRQGDVLTAGTTARTGANSTMDIFLGPNGSGLRLTPSTTVALEKLVFTRTENGIVFETKLNLLDGRILGSVHKRNAASKYEIKTPTGVAEVKDVETGFDRGAQDAGGK